MRTLLIDNYDSYTYNLYQLIAQVYGEPPEVLTNDAAALSGAKLERFDAIVISPGPGSPVHARDVGMCLQVISATRLPILGVCLGHEMIAYAEGCEIVPAPTPRHGYQERIAHLGEDLFAGMPQQFKAVRYHSLMVKAPLPERLEATAWAPDGTVMAIRHLEKPWRGVQFHPESIATEHGALLLENFRACCV